MMISCRKMALLGSFLYMITVPAIGQEHHHPPQDVELHNKFYSTWLMPDSGRTRVSSCCNLQDCYPTTIKRIGDKWYARRREDGAWIWVPDSKLESNQSDPRDSPDGSSHVCMSRPEAGANVYCAVLGSAI